MPDNKSECGPDQNLRVRLATPLQARPEPATKESFLGDHDHEYPGRTHNAYVKQGLVPIRFAAIDCAEKGRDCRSQAEYEERVVGCPAMRFPVTPGEA